MQNTRLTVLTNNSITRLKLWFGNPWRRTSIYVISPLLGFLLASVASTVLGAQAWWDPFSALILVLIIELINRAVYRQSIVPENPENSVQPRSLFLECLNLLKIGFVYGMILDALKLGS